MIENKLAEKLTGIAIKQLAAGLAFKKPRMDEIKKAEDLYLLKTKPALKGRFNIPIPVMGGFIDTLYSKIDEPIMLNFKETEEADLMKARKIKGAWVVDSGSTRGKWTRKDRMVKKLAIFSGRGIYKYYASSDGGYSSHLEPIDYYDFIAEPQGGADLNDHLFHGQINIFRTKNELDSDLYNQEQVQKLLDNENEEADRKNHEEYENKNNRFQALGLDTTTNNYVGQQLFNLTEWVMKHEGVNYYLFFDAKTGIWVRAEELKDIFSLDKTHFISWATHEDAFNFWSKAPADDLRPVCEAIHLTYNQAFEARQKTIWGQRGYDPRMVPDPKQLEYRPDGLVAIKTSPGRPIQDHIYEFKAPDIGDSLELIQWTINNLGVDTGIKASARGESEEKRVGIHFSELQQVADRLGMYNKSYNDAQDELGERYQYGLRDHITEGFMVEMIGEDGTEWSEVTKGDTIPNYDITTSSSLADAQADEVLRRSKAESLADPGVLQSISPKWRTENVLRNAGWAESDIRAAMDIQNEGSQESIAEAADENQRMYHGKQVKPNRSATAAHLQRHLNYVTDKDLKPEIAQRIFKHMESEKQFALENMNRKAQNAIAQMGGAGGETPTAPNLREQPVQSPNIGGTAGGVMRRSQELTNQISPIK